MVGTSILKGSLRLTFETRSQGSGQTQKTNVVLPSKRETMAAQNKIVVTGMAKVICF